MADKETKKNRFQGMISDDSDDEPAQRVTKTQKKKEVNKIADKPVKTISAKQTQQLESDGFNVIDNVRPTTGRGGRGAGDRGGRGAREPRGEYRGRGGEGRGRGGERGRGGDRGGARGEYRGRGGDRGGDRGGERGRGGRGRGRGGADGDRPRTAGPPRLDADGNPIANQNRRERTEHHGDENKEHGGYDRQDGTGRGGNRGRKQGAGKFNEGQRPDQQYKKKDSETVENAEGATTEQQESDPVREEAKEEFKEVILGVSLDDFLKEKPETAAKKSRAAEGAKGVKVEENKTEKVHTRTMQKNQYQNITHGKAKHASELAIGFQAMGEEEDDSGRGGRGGRGRGARVQGGDRVAKEGGRRQTARKALAKTEEDFPTL